LQDDNMKTIVLGVGNPILQDDGVGIHVVEEIRKKKLKNSDVSFDTAFTGGLNLLDMIRGYEKVILATDADVSALFVVGGSGTSVGTGGDDVTYPQSLGGISVKHYGTNFTNLSICSNGWLAMGTTTSTAYDNVTLPSTSFVPNGIVPFWDDLNLTSAGTWWYCADEAAHRFVAEWDSVPLYSNSADRQTFEVILNDTTLTPSTARTTPMEMG
jgi:hypothetical protein